ncbi:hypothetical protein NQ315_008161 [Exocentrus adspersus]|uniref:Gustatory receptor n=1 Tax=Exocentrus adspersus TaxID=1586481 RepID=A0AAV8VWS2_9CUCU|nr:hypothetical protein NQ315_008161 [Exocentrus adspersus]
MQKWREVDLSMGSYSYPYKICYKLKLVSAVILVAALAEHALFVASKYTAIPDNEIMLEKINIYFNKSYDQIFSIVPYSIYIGILMQVLDIYSVFAWNYKDLFIILISIVLSHRFEQIFRKIRLMSKYKVSDEFHWRRVREDYLKLSALCKLVDALMANIVVLSFTHNLFVVLVQFMYILHENDHTLIQRFYFIYSFGFLIMRIICVCLFAAEIYCVSRKPLEVLTSLPTEIHNKEIDRFILQVKTNPAYLSGGEFFIITKSLVLRISGAIVAYELVLIQMYYYK